MASNFNQPRTNPVDRINSDKCPFSIMTESNTFYKNLSNSFNETNERATNSLKSGKRFFRNQTEIPNHLKRNTFERSMILQCITDNKIHSIVDLIGERLNERAQLIYLHVTREQNILILKNQNKLKNVVIDSFQTYILPASRAGIIYFQSFEDVNVIALEVILNESQTLLPSGDLVNNVPVDKMLWDSYKSFTLSPIFDESQQLVFLASRFAYDAEGVPHLAAVTLINHIGQRILNTLSCPRKMIINYATPHTGITEKQLRGAADHYKVYEMLKEKLRGRIIVGYKVSQQLTRMLIDPKIIRGVRDLSTTTTIKKQRQDGEFWTFQVLTDHLNEHNPKNWTTMSEAALVYRLYKKLAKEWVDDFAPWEADMEKVPWDLVNWNANYYQVDDTEPDYIIPGRANVKLPEPSSLPRIIEDREEVDMDISTDDEYKSCDSDIPEKWECEKSEKGKTESTIQIETIPMEISIENEARPGERESYRDCTPEKWEYERSAKEITEPVVQIDFGMESEVWLEDVDDEEF